VVPSRPPSSRLSGPGDVVGDSSVRYPPEEALSRKEALRLYTINNAQFMFLENKIGSIEKGKFADLVIVDRDPLTCPIDDLPKTQVLTTFLAGKVVYQIASPLDSSRDAGGP